MRWVRVNAGFLLGVSLLYVGTGCVSLSEHERLKTQHRTAMADKTALEQELFDVRAANESLRNRLESVGSELEAKDELLTNLRSENSLLDEMRKTAQTALEDMAQNQNLGKITIATPKLPEALDTALKRFAQDHPDAVAYDPARGTVKWKADLLFATGSDVVKESSIEALRSFTQVLLSPAAAEFEALVVGHTDTQPIVRPETRAKHPTNWHLSAHRAIAVAFALQRYGYQPERLGIMGFGEYRPVADNDTEAGRAQNRRVEIYLIPRGSIVTASAGPNKAGAVETVAGTATAP